MENVNEIIKYSKNLTLLYVEDNVDARETTLMVLDDFFDTTIIAIDGKDGLEKFKEYDIDIIITDINMPVLNGLEMSRQIRQINPTIPIIITSAYNEENFLLESIRIGINHYLLKPLDLEQLKSILSQIIQKYKYEIEAKKNLHFLEVYKEAINLSSIVSKTDLKGVITYVNDKFCDISGYSRDELLNKSHNIVRHPDMPKDIFKQLWQTIQDNKQPWFGQIKNRKKDGSAYWVETVINPILDQNGNIVEYIAMRKDITDIVNPKKILLDKIKHSTFPFLVILKIVNRDILNKFYGQEILDNIEANVENHIWKHLPKDCIFNKIYKLDNGEFAFFEDCKSCNNILLEQISLRLKQFQDKINNNVLYFDYGELDINILISYAFDKEELFESVELGLEIAEDEKNNFICANGIAKKFKNKAQKNLKTIKLIKTAINTNNIVSYFQPIIDNKTRQIVKYESLVRLINQDGSVVSPYFFIDMAKKGGYYNKITNIVIDNIEKALQITDKQLSLNLSSLDIENVYTRNKLINLVSTPQYYGRLMFELLEDEIINDFQQIKDFIEFVKVIGGVTIAIDDFGAGYSNFERLLDFQPDILKIDGSLIKNITTDKFSFDIVETIVAFAKKQNIQITAEFIENEEIFNVVNNLGIEFSQGYYFGKPALLE